MIKRKLDLRAAMDVALYGRMSSDAQNERSPEQQFDAIHFEISRMGLHWKVIAEYRDDALSGRLVKRRPGLMKLINDIRTGKLKVRAILVHSFERFGRADEMSEIREMLYKKYGVLILTCDSGFADPTTIAGKALSFVEQIRATSVNPVKAADVFRGKKDLALQKHWPGGPPPFGYKLKYHLREINGKPEIDFATLEPDPSTAWVLIAIFEQAFAEGWGSTRLARWSNQDARMSVIQIFYPATIAYWLDNPIYYGELLWAENATDVIDDVRVLQPNDVEDQIRVPDFCPPLISRELWDAVQEMRNLRRPIKNAEGDSYRPLGAGRVLKLMLTGLVRCAECGCSMQPTSSGRKSKKGQQYRYYRCPRAIGDACSNTRNVREDHLRKIVISTIREELFPINPAQSIPAWLPSLFDQVKAELARLSDKTPDRRESLRHQISQLDAQSSGWLQSLGKPDLPVSLRAVVEQRYTAASEKRSALAREISELEFLDQRVEELLDPREVLEALKRLDNVLAGTNPTMANVELSRHIDRIDAHADGRVVLRACRLGILRGAVPLLAQQKSFGPTLIKPDNRPTVVARARPKLRVDDDADEVTAQDLSHSSDLHRFAGLPPSWFWEKTLVMPETKSWSAENAAAVAMLWNSDRLKWTMPKLASEFNVSIPTARKALRMGQKAAGIEVKRREMAARGIEDFRTIADEAAQLYIYNTPPMSIRDIAFKYSVNQITVSKALDHYYEKKGLPRPDGRTARKGRLDPDATPADSAGNPDLPGHNGPST